MGSQVWELGLCLQGHGQPGRGSHGRGARLEVCVSQVQLSGGDGGEAGLEAAAFIQTREVRPGPECACGEVQTGTASQGAGGWGWE